eukprot:COSAG01_NODE_496_length_16290_cov_48.639244_5_plen_153_part_00
MGDSVFTGQLPVPLQPPTSLQAAAVTTPQAALQPPTTLQATAVQHAPVQPAPVVQPPPVVQPATAVRMPTTAMSTASAVVAQSAHNVMQQALSLQSSDQIVLYDNLRKHLHSEGLLRGMSVSAKSKRRVMCLKEGCPGCMCRLSPLMCPPTS